MKAFKTSIWNLCTFSTCQFKHTKYFCTRSTSCKACLVLLLVSTIMTIMSTFHRFSSNHRNHCVLAYLLDNHHNHHVLAHLPRPATHSFTTQSTQRKSFEAFWHYSLAFVQLNSTSNWHNQSTLFEYFKLSCFGKYLKLSCFGKYLKLSCFGKYLKSSCFGKYL